jgi:hypothetical protein
MKRKLKKRFVIGYVVMGIVLMGALFLSYESQAQTSRPAAGIKGGLNVSNLYKGDNVTDKNARIGFHGGVYGQFASSEAFALQIEANYSTRGTEAITDGFIDQKTKFNLNYIDVPLLAVFKLGPIVELHAGAYGAYLVNASIDSDGDLGDTYDDLNKDNFKAFDYGLVGGIGFTFGAAQVGARYNLGLNEIADSRGAKMSLGSSKNQLAQLYLAFNLNHQPGE